MLFHFLLVIVWILQPQILQPSQARGVIDGLPTIHQLFQPELKGCSFEVVPLCTNHRQGLIGERGE